MCSHCADFMCLLKLALLIFAVPEVPQVNSIVFSHSALTCISKAIGAPGTNTGLGTEGTRPPGPGLWVSQSAPPGTRSVGCPVSRTPTLLVLPSNHGYMHPKCKFSLF